jgi:hypothetical protein
MLKRMKRGRDKDSWSILSRKGRQALDYLRLKMGDMVSLGNEWTGGESKAAFLSSNSSSRAGPSIS